MKRKVKDIAASVRGRLLKIAKATGRDFNAILRQYFQERLLYRLSISDYKDHFVLKGALLFTVYNAPLNRPTKDIDFLGVNISFNEQYIIDVIKKIVSIEYEDGVLFDSDSITSEIIRRQEIYPGIRIKCNAHLGQAQSNIFFDIAFGDIIIPKPLFIDFPVILESIPAPKIFAYTPESAIAEKFEAIVKFSFFTSRMKDFFDIYHLLKHYRLDSCFLKEAIEETFSTRKTDLENRKVIYSEDFTNDSTLNRQWNAFLKRIDSNIGITFKDCIEQIKSIIEPLFETNN